MRLKSFVYLAVMVSLLALGGLFVLKKPNGQPWLTLADLGLNNPIQSIKNIELPTVSGSDGGQTTVYRWRDQNGWQFSDTFPEGFSADQVKEITINPDTNLIQGFKLPEPEPVTEPSVAAKPKSGEDTLGSQLLNNIPLPMTIQGEELQQLINDAKGLQNLSDEQAQALEDLLKR